MVLDPESGAVKSIFDKELNKELVNTSSPYRFNQYLYVTGGDKQPNASTRSSSALPLPEFTDPRRRQRTPDLCDSSAFWRGGAPGEPGGEYPQDRDGSDSVQRREKNRIHQSCAQERTRIREGIVYFAFPFAMEHPQFRYEIQNGFVDPSRDQMPGAGKEWFSVQHWVAADEGGVSVALVPSTASLVCLGDIFRATWPEDFGQRPGTIFSYVMNNYWDTNYAAGQGGDFTFRYVLTSGDRLDPASLSRLGWER